MPYQFQPSVERWRQYLSTRLNGNTELVDKALWIINYESGGNPDAVGDNGASIGLFQIQSNVRFPNRPTADWLRNANNNIDYALDVLGLSSGNARDWGEGTNGLPPYNPETGQGRFGALGNHPFPGPTSSLVRVAGIDGSTGDAPPATGGAVDWRDPRDWIPPAADPRSWVDPRTWIDPTSWLPGRGLLPGLDDIPGVPKIPSPSDVSFANVQSTLSAVRQAITWLLDPHHWARLGFMLVGGLMVGAGVWLLASSQGVPSPASVAKTTV